jgi:16S rRNA (uracil1498-N3)-methyltransferase
LARPPRFYSADSLEGDFLLLDPEEARHATGSRRLKPMTTVEVFDGQGSSRLGTIQPESRNRVRVSFTSPLRIEPPPAQTLTVALSPPKGERMNLVVEKLSELGCHTVIPVIFRHSKDAGVRRETGKVARWRRKALEAAKQCGRNRILTVTDPVPLADLLNAESRPDSLIALDCEGQERMLGERLTEVPGAAETVILVGPEGGFTDRERDLLQDSGARSARIGSAILRIETAAIAAAALWGELRRME